MFGGFYSPINLLSNSAEQINLDAQGLIAQNYDRQYFSTSSAMVDGTIYFVLVPLRAGQVVTNISICIPDGAGDTFTLSKAGLYATDGTRLAVSADQGDAWSTAGIKTVAMGSAYTVTTTGGYYAAVIAKASSMPSFFRLGVNSVPAVGIGSGVAPYGAQQGQTDLIASATIGSTSPIAFWAGIS